MFLFHPQAHKSHLAMHRVLGIAVSLGVSSTGFSKCIRNDSEVLATTSAWLYGQSLLDCSDSNTCSFRIMELTFIRGFMQTVNLSLLGVSVVYPAIAFMSLVLNESHVVHLDRQTSQE